MTASESIVVLAENLSAFIITDNFVDDPYDEYCAMAPYAE